MKQDIREAVHTQTPSADSSTYGDIAIVGIGCRLPGSANSPEAFWRLLRDGIDAITEMPSDRFDLERLFDADVSHPAKMYTRWGGFMDSVDGFDSAFFGLSPREAVRIDPQHRLLLEVTWEALEDAGLSPDRLAGTATGVFIGISTHDYGDIEMYPVNRALLDGHSNTGTAAAIAANRISYVFDFRGPSLIVDTACSSSLTAVHLACQSLHSGESTCAVAGGVQLLLAPELTMGFCRASMLSPDGRCRAFDARANGYVRSEGAGVIVLRPVADAIANGDPIYAVIKGSAINQDGHTNGMTVPSAAAQEKAVRQAFGKAGLTARDVHYIEAHGPGTPVGDPIEAEGLGAVMRDVRGVDEPCLMGSVKTNIGHLEAASGIAGIIKTALAIHHRLIPASLHYVAGNPAIDFEAYRLRVVTEPTPWPAGGPATAGLNSFGFGGANAHVILQEAPPPARDETPAPESSPRLLMLSSRSAEGLRDTAKAYLEHIQSRGDLAVRDLAWSSAMRRAHLDHRLTVVGSAREDFLDGLDAFLATETRADVATGRRRSPPPKIAFVFSGMGPQWWGMGRQLMVGEPCFRDMIARCDAALRQTDAEWSLLDELMRDEATSRVSHADLAQVTNFAIQVALSALWRSWGISPGGVIGHSAGEMAAAWTAGVFDLETGVRLAYHRGRLQALAAGEGKMLAVGAAAADIVPLLRGHERVVSLAAVNSPTGITLAGDAAVLEDIRQALEARQVFARFLPVDVPYHSPKMDKIEQEIRSSLADLELSDASVPMVSIVSGDWTEGRSLDAGYWWRNIRQPVLFAPGIEQLIAAGFDTFVEVSPHPVLAQSIQETLANRGVVLPTLRRMEGERHIMLRTLGALHVRGCDADLAAVYGGDGRHVPLPTYRWQRERQWFVSNDAVTGFSDLSGDQGPHPLLKTRLPAAIPLWETPLGGSATAYLDDHLVQGATVYPGAAYVETALGAARALAPDKIPALRDVAFHRALFLPERDVTRLQFSVTGEDRHFEVHSIASALGEWSRHATGLIAPRDREEPVKADLDAIRARCRREMRRDDFYALVHRRGVQLEHAFRGIQSIWLGEGEAIAAVATQGFDRQGYEIHPAFLDALFQPLIAAAESIAGSHQGVFLPIRIGEVILHARPDDHCWSHARVTNHDGQGVTGDIHVYADDGGLVVTIRALGCAMLDSATAADETVADWLYDLAWEPDSLGATVAARSVIGREATIGAGTLAAEADRLASEWEWDRYYTEVEPRLDALARSYVVTAIRQLGFDFGPGARIDLDAFAERHRVDAGRRPLLRSLFGILTDDGALVRDGDGWLVVRRPQGDERRHRAALTGDWPRYALEIDLLDRCGANLAAVLRGEIDSGSILFAEASFETMRTFYREAPTSRIYNVLLGRAVGRLTASADRTRPLRILEIGGGTGGTTGHVLPLLPSDGVDYLFTDVSAFFTQRAIELFGSRDGFSTQLFDVERDPVEQGLAAESFDLVIASNVLHTTRSIGASLAHVEGLVAPGGALVLMEITRHPDWLDLIFGLTDGWWRFEDHALRSSHPILSEGSWRSLLTERGWLDVQMLSDANRPGEAAQTVVAARWEGRPEAESEKRWLIFADRQGIASRVIESLRDVVVVRAGDGYRQIDARSFEVVPGRRDHLVALVHQLDADGTAFDATLHLWSLDAAPPEQLSLASLREAQRTGVESVLALLQTLDETGRTLPELWIVTSASQPMTGAAEPLAVAQAPIWGLSRVINSEHPDVRCRAVDLSAALDDRDIAMLVRDLHAAPNEDELAYRDGNRFVRRLMRRNVQKLENGEPYRPTPEEAWQVEVGTPGVIGSIGLRQMERSRPGPGEVELRVCAASLNFREVVLATDTIPGLERESPFLKRQLGVDCAGVITAVGAGVEDLEPGDEVLAFASGTHRAFAITSQRHVLRKPEGLTFEEAASIPGVFLTAHFALRDLARIRRGDRVLIHAATGGVGLAAIEVARDAGAEIFATAGSPEKRAYLTALGVRHVMNSRTLDFAGEILSATGGRGVDVVLNSLAGEAMARSMTVLAPFGRFVEIGKKDLYADSRIAMGALRHNISYYTLDLDLLVAARSEDVRQSFVEIVERIVDGRYRLAPITVFPFSRAEDAVRTMAQGRHIGKIVLTTRDPDLEVRPSPRAINLSGDGTVLITGGMGGFGFACAQRLARLGVSHLVLAGRGGSGDENDPRLAMLRAAGAEATFIRCDVTDAAAVDRMIERIRTTMPPLRGVVHAAMVLDDAPLGQLDGERLDRVMDPKAAGAWNLHQATKDTAPGFFVMFSSLTSLIGNPLQANYAAANAFLDALCYYRRSLGLAAQTINWGVLSGVGWVAAHADIGNYLARQGYLSFSPDQALEVFEELLRLDPVHVMAARIDWNAWVQSAPAAAAAPRMRYFSERDTAAESKSRAGGDATLTALLEAPADEHRARLEDYLRARLGKVLGIAPARIDRERPLNEMGLDSLIAVELMTILKMDLAVSLPVVKLLQRITIDQLAAMVDEQRPAAAGPPTPSKQASPAAPTDRSTGLDSMPVAAASVAVPERTVLIGRAPHPAIDGLGASRTGAAVPAPPATFRRPQRIARQVIGAGFRVVTKLDVEGLQNFPPSGGCIVTANHLSLMDVPLLFSVLPRPTVLFASEHLRNSAFMRWILTDIGDTIWVRRGEGDQAALQLGLDVLEGGGVLGIGPEGTRSRSGRLGPAHTGPAYLAARSGAAIVPIAVWGQEKMGRGWTSLRRPPVHVRIGPPLVFPNDASPDGVRLTEMTGAIMSAIATMLPAAYRGDHAG